MTLAVPMPTWRPPGYDARPWSSMNCRLAASRSSTTRITWSMGMTRPPRTAPRGRDRSREATTARDRRSDPLTTVSRARRRRRSDVGHDLVDRVDDELRVVQVDVVAAVGLGDRLGTEVDAQLVDHGLPVGERRVLTLEQLRRDQI